MPHIIDFDGIEQKLFTLQHICYGSRNFCEKIKLNRTNIYHEDYEWWEYTGILKSIVSNTIIESAVKVRILQDFVKSDEQEVDLAALDRESLQNVEIGRFVVGNQNLTLRESCNKIIHATEARMQWININPSDDESNEYWSGLYDLHGVNRGKAWHVELNVESWCIAMIRFNKLIQENVDWHHVFKHDE
ncbi:TPA: hypothetical protein PKO72_003643 [Aeromonas hydrophila]|uniref:hypothetical protein n=1 Tax=Aeromonas hydrophila TaxID=644 RepID=UPI001CCF0EB0|nr:hypothetical protein [Aeromonas hydrophila]UBQ51962.1 hypothetical protein LCH17_07635 [Aeromonas hydrophila]HDI1214865.1 hypothetical protein [Aeromonas hydrophila]